MDKQTELKLRRMIADAWNGDPDEVEMLHVRETPEPCDHDFSDGDYCSKCGMWIMVHAMTECP